jgi:hypothetical protein
LRIRPRNDLPTGEERGGLKMRRIVGLLVGSALIATVIIMIRDWRTSVFALILTVLIQMANAYAIPVFPGAEGFGTDTPGGRGGTVYKVTNLDASGSGSLKECIDATGPRVCVFEVSGTIVLTDDLWIRNPYITIAGQTAPSPGITIRGAAIRVSTHDVVIQHLRIRVGDAAEGPSYDNRDAFYVESNIALPYNIVLDHCSLSWSVDELAGDWYENNNVTFQWCIFSEPLHCNNHPKGCHGAGVLIGPGSSYHSFHHNLIANAVDRNPLYGGSNSVQKTLPAVSYFETINNVVYNWDYFATRLTRNAGNKRSDQPQYGNLIGNYYKEGPNTSSDYGIWVRDIDVLDSTRIYVSGNIGPSRPTCLNGTLSQVA